MCAHSHTHAKLPVPNNVVLALEERGFCAVLCKGEASRVQSKNIADFLPVVKKASVAWIDYVTDDFDKEAVVVAAKLGFSEVLVRNLLKGSHSGYEDFENEMGIRVPAILVTGFDVVLEPLLILIRKNMVVTLHTSETKRFFRIRRYAETLLRKLPSSMNHSDKITMILIRIIDENNARNFDHLQEIEAHGDALSKQLSDPKSPRDVMGKQIYEMKHALIVYLGGLWATVDALNSLRYGDADLITDNEKILERISLLVGEVNAQIGLAEHLSEVLASGLEVLQSIYNNQLQILNNRLALLVSYLTIIGTALLVPNTIATVAGNSMFNFTSKDVGWYLALISVSTVVAMWLSWLFVKKMGLLPNKPDAPD